MFARWTGSAFSTSAALPPVSASIFNFDKPAVTYETEVIGAE
jgi:hypothetical protein